MKQMKFSMPKRTRKTKLVQNRNGYQIPLKTNKIFPLRVFAKVKENILQEGIIIEVENAKNTNAHFYTLIEFGTPRL